MAKDKDSRKRAMKILLEALQVIDPSGDNVAYAKRYYGRMSDKEFDKFMRHLKKGETRVRVILPNMKSKIDMEAIVAFADKIGCELEVRIRRVDPDTGIVYTTPYKGLLLTLPVRRQIQTEDSKLSVPDDVKRVDRLTGQVVGPDKACSISMVETQSVATKNTPAVLDEFVVARGGNLPMFAKMNEQLEEHGIVRLSDLPQDTRARSGHTFNMLLKSMMLDNNF